MKLIGTNSTRLGNSYDLLCLDLPISDIMSTLANNTNFIINGQNYTCDAYIAAATITAERKMSGVKFAHPYYQGSLGIMIKNQKDLVAGWNWVQPFSTELWVAIIITILVWPTFLFVIELISISKTWGKAGDAVRGVEEASWQALWCVTFGDTIDVVSIGARVAAVTFGLLALVITSTYTANLAAFLTLSKFAGINSVEDLRGRLVASTSAYISNLEAAFGWFGVLTKNISSDSTESLKAIVGEVSSGALTAFLYDLPMLRSVVGSYDDPTISESGQCPVRLLPETVLPFAFGLAFPKQTSMDLVDEFSVAIIKLQEDVKDGTQGNVITGLAAKALNENSKCLEDSLSGGNNDKITFESVYGLWVIAGCGLLLGFIIALGVRVYRNKYGWQVHKDNTNSVLGHRPRHLEPMVSAEDEDGGDRTLDKCVDNKLDGGRV